MNTRWTAIFSVIGFAGVALGAFGAHGLKAILTPESLEWWKTGIDYLFWHTLAGLFVVRSSDSFRFPPLWSLRFFSTGILIFSGSLFTMAITQIRILGAITPIGGIFLLLGWGSLIKASLWPQKNQTR